MQKEHFLAEKLEYIENKFPTSPAEYYALGILIENIPVVKKYETSVEKDLTKQKYVKISHKKI